MKFCTNCGKEISEDAVFCTGCGKQTENAAGTDATARAEVGSTVISGQPETTGTFYQAGTPAATNAYYPPASQAAQGTPYYPPGPQAAQGTPYYPPGPQAAQGTPYYPPGTPAAQSAPYYQNAPYGGGPNYPDGGSGKNKKPLVIIISIIIGLLLIGGGILAYVLLSDKGDIDDPAISVTDTDVSEKPSEKPSEEPSKEPSEEPSEEPSPEPSENAVVSEAPAMLDAATQDNIDAACLDTGMDLSKIQVMEYYGTWFEGDVYTFTYDGSVVDVLLYDDGTVFSLETGGAQVYLISYDSYVVDDYLGYTTHFDESYPDSSYVFFMDRELIENEYSFLTVNTSDDLDYVIELIDANTGNMVIAFYMWSGRSASQMPVPSGDYIIQYAAGPSWVSISDLFGPDTVFFQSVDTYAVYDDSEATITLDVYGGSGIPSTEITYDDF